MSLSDLAAVGTFVSSTAVVFSLIFLALQMRQANLNQRSLMQQGRTARNVDTLLKMSDPFVGELVAEADRNCAAMDPAKIWAFYGFAGSIFWNYENSFLQFQANMLDARSWNSDATVLKRLLGYPAYRVAWKMARDSLSGNYRNYVDSIMREVKCETSLTLTDLWKTYVAEELTTRS
ncbi:MAG TPA: hypothetical protein VNX86_07925 [Rhizomicrobium sp.]|jgi:hypothetical protein|nr:hypothetical protein [Rhizomicrobium sp.]